MLLAIAAQVLVVVSGVCTTGSSRTCKLSGCATPQQICLSDRTWGPCTCDCGDQDACTQDTWSGSACTHTAVTADDGNACTVDACDRVLGVQHTPTPSGSSCSDGNPCNGVESCNGAGVCLSGTAPSVDDGNPCTIDGCDPVSGVYHSPAAAGTSCSDGNACNGAELCNGAGTCTPGTPLVLDDLNPCTTDTCDPVAGVSYRPAPAGTSCSDGDVCNGDEVCNGGGACLAGTALVADDANPCTADSCDPVAGVLHAPVSGGMSCSDGDYCNGYEVCDGAGTCLAGLAPSPDDGNVCTIDRCDPATGVWNDPAPASTPCSDGDICNGLEMCNGAGACGAGVPPDLADGNPCTTDTCDRVVGITHVPAPAGTECSDGNICNGVETCDAAASCHPGQPLDVEDGNPCTTGTCDPVAGVVQVAVAAGTSCSDGNACNGVEACDGAGACFVATPAPVDDGNPCTIDSCDPVSGIQHVFAEAGASCSDGDACNGPEACDGAGACVQGAAPRVDDGDRCTIDSCDPILGVSHVRLAGCDSIPPDPAGVAPPLDPAAVTPFADTVAFLYSGADPIQSGVEPGAVEPERAAVVRGIVTDRDGAPLPGVRVSVVRHPELGSTSTRTDGAFDLAVNGGSVLTLDYDRDGYLPAHRQVDVPWNDHAWAPDVALVPFDPAVSEVAAGASTVQVVRGSAVTDGDGARQATIVFPAGTQAVLQLEGGATLPLATFHVRATEYTVGSTGRSAMPAELPTASAYTYAVELSVDEAIAWGARGVAFDRAVPVYVENFLSIPVGWPVPSGYYDRERMAWVPSTDGRVVKIISVSNGVAALDVTGDDVADDGTALAPLGISSDELVQLASSYPAGQSLWRVPVAHFSTWDFNYAWGCEVDSDGQACPSPVADDPTYGDDPEPDPCLASGSIIECENQTLGEEVPVVGTPYALSYRSQRQLGRKAERIVTIHLPTKVSSKAVGMRWEVYVAGQRLTQRVPTTETGTVTYAWNGRDAYGRPHQGSADVVVKVGFVYVPVYAKSLSTGGLSFAGGTHGTVFGRFARVDSELVTWKTWKGKLDNWTARPLALGGWTLSAHHAYDPISRKVYLGDGRVRAGTPVDSHVITTIANTGWPVGIAIAPDGTIYSAEDWVVKKTDRYGRVTNYAGGGSCTSSVQSGIPATQACLHSVYDVSLSPDGSLYLAGRTGGPGGTAVRRVRPDGIIEDFAGAYSNPLPGDEIPALRASVGFVPSVAAAPDGSVYILGNDRIRKVTPDGIIHAFAGTGGQCCSYGGCGTCCYGGDGGPAYQALVCGGGNYGKVAVGPDGSVYLGQGSRVRRVRPDGIIVTFAGTSVSGFNGDGRLATTATLYNVAGVSVASDGSVYIADRLNGRIRRVSPSGIIQTIAGSGGSGFSGDGGPAAAAKINSAWHAVEAPSGDLVIADSYNARIRRVGAPLPGFTLGEYAIASEDGREVYVFDGVGRHVRTVDALTNVVTRSFGYDTAGRLASITDADGLITTIERSGETPIAIVAPHGQRTTLGVDGNGYLNSITNPASETRSYGYDADGMMLSFTDPRRNLHTFRYDAVGRLDLDSDAVGGWKSLTRTTRPDGYQVAVTTALGRATVHDVARVATGDKTRMVTQPDGTVNAITERTNGTKTLVMADGTTWATTVGPDPRFGMAAPLQSSTVVTTPAGLQRSTAHTATVTLQDPANPLSLTGRTDQWTVNGRAATATYSAGTRMLTTTSAGGRTFVETLDAKGRPATLQLPGVPLITLARDATGLLRTVTQGVRTTTFDYDGGGFGNGITDPASRVTSWTNDAAGRPIQEVLPGNRTVGLGYDANGNLSSVTPPGREAHGFDHDGGDRLATYSPPLVDDVTAASTTYGYDLDGALTAVLLPGDGTIVPGYDSAGRLATLTTARGIETVTYDDAGRVWTVTTPEAQQVTFGYDGFLPVSETSGGIVAGVVTRTYDSDFRVSTLSVNGGAGVSFNYDADGLLTGAGALAIPRAATTGWVTGTTLGTVSTTNGYSSFGEHDSVTASVGGVAVYGYTLNRDASGRIDGVTETLQGTTSSYVYGYDPAGRLESVTRDGLLVEWYGYDDNGNRLTATVRGVTANGTFDAQDRMKSYGNASYTYGPAGDLRSRTEAGQTTWYSYDGFGNLLQVLTPDGAVVDYVVDGLNRRVGKKVNGVTVEGFVYDGELRPVAWLDGAGNVYARFVYGTRVNVPEYMITASGTFRILTDHLGSPRLVVDSASGAVAQRIDYDAYGQVLTDSSPGFQPFGFAGGLYDRDTALVRFGARDYDPETGRWTSKDRTRFRSGLNVYGYVDDDPLNWIDPNGMEKVPPPTGPNGDPLPPPVPPPPGKNGEPNSWVPVPGTGARPIKWKPKYPVANPGGGQPGASWDPADGHWDVDNGRGDRRVRYLPDGTPVYHSESSCPSLPRLPPVSPTVTTTAAALAMMAMMAAMLLAL